MKPPKNIPTERKELCSFHISELSVLVFSQYINLSMACCVEVIAATNIFAE